MSVLKPGPAVKAWLQDPGWTWAQYLESQAIEESVCGAIFNACLAVRDGLETMRTREGQVGMIVLAMGYLTRPGKRIAGRQWVADLLYLAGVCLACAAVETSDELRVLMAAGKDPKKNPRNP